MSRRTIALSLLFLPTLLMLTTPRARAATYNIPAGDVAQLLVAIDAANATPQYDKIVLAANSTYWIWAAFGGDSTGLPVISSYIEITAPDGETASIRRDGAAPSFRLFQVHECGILRLDGITVAGGRAGSAGAIKNFGTLIVERCTIADNSAPNTGAIRNDGDLSMVDSTIIGNSSTDSDTGALLNVGNAVLDRCTFADNWANRGAGAIGNAGYLRAVNSTFSGNVADVGGGAIVNNGGADLWLESVTVTNNTADADSSGGGEGGGILVAPGGNAHARNSLIAGNFDNSLQAGGKHPDVSGELFSQGYNLIGNADGANIVGDVMTNLIGYDDLFLGPLADNGGWTDTHKLLPGSPAIDTGNSSYPGSTRTSCDETDQRNYARPADGDGNGVALCDIGAYERGANPFLPPGGGKITSPTGDPDPGKRWTAPEPQEPSAPFTRVGGFQVR